jgi:hypothetical protein
VRAEASSVESPVRARAFSPTGLRRIG